MAEETIQCWSCGTRMTLDELSANDGDCPECEVEIALAEYLSKALAENAALRAKAPSQGGEAVEVLTTWHPDSRSYEEQIVSHDTKGSRKALGAMNAKLRVKVGRLERELAAVKQSLTVEPVAYAAFAENGNIRMWCRSAIGMCELFDAHGNKAVPLYTHPADQVAEGVVVPLIKAAIKYIDSQVFYKFGEPVTKADREGRRIADELRQLLATSEGEKP